jgi:hypothetical protein
MAISITRPVAAVSNTTNTTTYSTVSFTPTANSFLFVVVFITGSNSITPTFSGLGLNWYLHSSILFGGNEMFIYWAKVDGNPQTGTLTFTCADDPATGCFIVTHQATGHDQVTIVPIKQAITNSGNTSDANGTFPIALDTNNGYIIGYVGGLTVGVSTPPSGWTTSTDGDYTGPAANFYTARRSTGETGTTYTITNPITNWAFVGIEVYADGAGPRPTLAALGSG